VADAPRVTVITIFYQAERFLEEAIDSVLGQTFSSWELLLVDDGSTDDGTAIARRYAAAHPDRIRHLEHDGHANLGMSASRNRGVHTARGEYIAFLDADDVWFPTTLDDQVRILGENDRAAMVFGRTLYWHSWTGDSEDVKRDWLSGMPTEGEDLIDPPHLLTAILRRGDTCPCIGSALIRRRVIEAVGGCDEDFRDLSEDWALWAKIFAEHRVFVSGRSWIRYRQHPDSMCARATRDGDRVTAAHSRYLAWLERYLLQRGVRDPALWMELRLEARRSARTMSVVEAREVVIAPPDARLVGRAIDRPRPGERSVGASVDLLGWVLGRSSRAVAVEVLHEDRVVQRMTLDHRRPDLTKAFPDVPQADEGGFRTQLQTVGMGEVEVTLQAVLADQDRVPLATLRLARRWREDAYHAAAPLVSVVIPCYDQARFLPEAIESVQAQSYPHLELVVVDDGSHDNTSEVAARYPGVRLVRQENAGLSAARNTGLRHTNGAYLVFLDADDRLLPNALADGLAAFAEHPEAAFVAGRYRTIEAGGREISEFPMAELGKDPYETLLLGNIIAMHGAVMYQRLTLQAMGGFDPSLDACEDYDVYLRIAPRMPIATHDGLVAEYRRHGSAMSDDPHRMRRAALRVLSRQLSVIGGHDRLMQAYEAGRRYWLGHYPARSGAGSDFIRMSSARNDTGTARGLATAQRHSPSVRPPSRGASSASRGRAAQPARVLMYHRISEPDHDPWSLAVSPRHFSEHLEVLRRERRVMTLTEATHALGDGRLPDGVAVVTFDDGYADNLYAGLPALEQHDIPATIFLSTGYLDRTTGFWWDELQRLVFDSLALPDELHLSVRGAVFDRPWRGGPGLAAEAADPWRALAGQPATTRQSLYEALWRWMQPLLDAEREQVLVDVATRLGIERVPAGDDRTLTLVEAGRMAQHPLLELGAHTITHPRLAALTPSLQRVEIRQSKRAVEGITGRPAIAMAYPFGGETDIGGHSTRFAREAGYITAFMAVPHIPGHERDPFRVPRHHVADWDGDQFARWLGGADGDVNETGLATPQEEPAPLVGAPVP